MPIYMCRWENRDISFVSAMSKDAPSGRSMSRRSTGNALRSEPVHGSFDPPWILSRFESSRVK